jgi:peroxin-1
MAPKKPAATAEIALIPLKNCLVNLPPSLVSLLVNANTVSIQAAMTQWTLSG